jgi:hypothetical protein
MSLRNFQSIEDFHVHIYEVLTWRTSYAGILCCGSILSMPLTWFVLALGKTRPSLVFELLQHGVVEMKPPSRE